MTECTSNDCDREAKFRAFWPGSTVEVCDPCLERACVIADVMGFKLTFESTVAERFAALTESQKAEMAAYMMEQDPE